MLLHIPVAFNQSNAISYCLKVAFTVRGHKQSEFHSGLELRGQLPFTVPSVSHAKNYPIPREVAVHFFLSPRRSSAIFARSYPLHPLTGPTPYLRHQLKLFQVFRS